MNEEKTLTAQKTEVDWDQVRDLTVVGLMVALMLFGFGNYWNSHWYTKTAFVVFAFSLFFPVVIAKRVGWVFYAPLAYFLFSAAYTATWPLTMYSELGPDIMTSMSKAGFYTMIALIMASMAVAFLPGIYKRGVLWSFETIAVASAFVTMVDSLDQPLNALGAFSGNPSMNACLIGALIPFVRNKWAIAMCVFAVLLTRTSQGVCVLAISGGMYLLLQSKYSTKTVLKGLAGLAAMVAVGAYVSENAFLADSGRFRVWQGLFHWWADNKMFWTGSGMSTGIVLFPYLQELNGTKDTGYFLWLHSDWLQMLFEGGIVGMLLATIAYLFILFRRDCSPKLRASLIGFGSMAIFNYPLRLPIHATCLTLVCWLILLKGRR